MRQRYIITYLGRDCRGGVLLWLVVGLPLTSLGYGKAYGDRVDSCQRHLQLGIPRLGFFKYLSNAEKVINSEVLTRQKEQIKNRVIREKKRKLRLGSNWHISDLLVIRFLWMLVRLGLA